MAGIGELGRIEVWVRKEMTTPEVKEGEEDPQNIINGQEKGYKAYTLVKKTKCNLVEIRTETSIENKRTR